MRFILALLAVSLVAGCGKSGGGNPSPPSVSCSATIVWEPPTERTSGQPLTLEELEKYTVYVSLRDSVEDQYIQQVIDVDINLITLEVRDLGPGPHWFYMTVTDLDGITSTQSNSLGIICPR